MWLYFSYKYFKVVHSVNVHDWFSVIQLQLFTYTILKITYSIVHFSLEMDRPLQPASALKSTMYLKSKIGKYFLFFC